MMSDTQLLRQMVNERLAAAAEEIFGLVEKTMVEYQDEVFRCRSEVIALKRQMEQLSVLKPEVQLLKSDVEACALHLPDQNLTLESSYTPDEEQGEQEQAKEEQLDLCSNSDPEEPDCYEDYQVPLSDSDLTCPTITVPAMQFKEEEMWNEMDNLVSPSSDPMYSDIPFTEETPSQRDKMKRSPIQKKQNKTCRLCHMCFQKTAELKRHMDKNHMGEKALMCPHCDKGFDQDYQWVTHVRIHTGEKPYSCDFCGKTFAQNSSRIVHMRQHTGEKPYYCHKCDKSFTSSNHLRYCKVSQKKEVTKACRCKTCGKTFSTDLDLRLHREVHMSWKRHLEEQRRKTT